MVHMTKCVRGFVCAVCLSVELTSQLEALKVIHQDMEKRKTSSRPPATLTPAATDQLR